MIGPRIGRSRRPLLLLVTAGLVAGCASVSMAPVGKGPAEFALEEDERRIWNRAQEEQEKLRRAHVEYDDPALRQYLNEVANRLLPEEARPAGLSLDVRIIKNPALNAFMLPHGVMYIHTGMLARMENEAQLATLLGHEMTHATHRHAVQRFRDLQNKAAFAATLGVVAVPLGAVGALVSLFGQLGTLAAVYGYSQEMETEADREGFQLMVRAGYDPREAPKLFRHLKEWVEEEKKPELFFFNTHPRLVERIATYEEALRRGEESPAGDREVRIGEEVFLARTRLLVLDNALLDLQAGRFLQAQKGIQKFLGLNPEDARAHYYLAETYRRQNDPKLQPEAIRLYEGAIALDPAFADPHKGLGSLYYRAGQFPEAAVAFGRYLELAPTAPDRGYIHALLEEVSK